MLQEQAMQMAFLEAQVEKVCKQRSAWTDSELDELKLKVQNQTMSYRDVLSFSELFALVDSDRSGQISSEEVAYLMRLIGNSVSLTEVDEMIASYDDDKSGELSLAEFLCVIADQRKSNHKKKDVMRAFELFAKDCGCRTGVISRDALLQALQNFGMSVATKDEIADVVGALPLTVTGDFDFSKHVSTFLS